MKVCEKVLPVASWPEANFPSGCGVTPLVPCATVPDVIVWNPGSVCFHVTVVPAVTLKVAG